MKKKIQAASFIATTVLFSLAVQAEAKIYGKIHMSADVVDIGAGGGHGLSSNASRIGFKGKQNLNYGIKVIWKIETELDITKKSEKFKSRNRYLGLNYKKSTLVIGFHDTPFKTIGKKLDVFPDSVADRRGMLGRDYINNSSFDVRAENAVMYVNKALNNLEWRFMRSAGAPNATAGDKTPITSTSFLYKKSQYMLGGAYEIKEAAADRTSGMRLLGGVAFGSTRVTAMIERLDLANNNARLGWGRDVFGVSIVHKVGVVAIKGQILSAGDLASVENSGGKMYAVGASYKLAKPFELYAVVSRLENKVNAQYTLTGASHGDVYRPSNAGANMHSISVGMIYKI